MRGTLAKADSCSGYHRAVAAVNMEALIAAASNLVRVDTRLFLM